MKRNFVARVLVVTMALVTVLSATSYAATTSGLKSINKAKKVDLIWYMRNATPINSDSVMEKANQIIGKEINATLDMRFVQPGDYNQKMQITQASGENYDICFTSWWANPYEPAALKGAYLPLDSYLTKFPEVKAVAKQQLWDLLKIDNKVYGVPNMQIISPQPGLWLKKSIVDKYKINYKNIKKLEDLTPILKQVQNGEPDMMLNVNFSGWMYRQNTELGGVSGIPGVDLNTKTWKILTYEKGSAETQRYNDIARDWYKSGYFPKDIATIKDFEPYIKAGKVFSKYQACAPGFEGDFRAKYGYDAVQVPLAPAILTRNTVASSLTAISTTSKNPERAMALVALVNTNKDLFRTLAFGIENQDYKLTATRSVTKLPGKYNMLDWAIGNTFNGFLLTGQSATKFADTKKLNDKAIVDPGSLINFDKSDITVEVSQLNAIEQEFAPIFKYGLADPAETMKLKYEKMKAVGVDKVVTVLQKQLDAWVAKNVKK